MKDVALSVGLFAVGHSTTMILGVLMGWEVSAYLIDAIMGFSVAYKALDNLGAFRARRQADSPQQKGQRFERRKQP